MQHRHPNLAAALGPWGRRGYTGKATKPALDSGGLLTVRTLPTSGIPLGTIWGVNQPRLSTLLTYPRWPCGFFPK